MNAKLYNCSILIISSALIRQLSIPNPSAVRMCISVDMVGVIISARVIINNLLLLFNFININLQGTNFVVHYNLN